MKLIKVFKYTEWLCFPIHHAAVHKNGVVVLPTAYFYPSLDYIKYVGDCSSLGYMGGIYQKGTKPVNPKLETNWQWFKRVYLKKF